jgi:hypothetical protein
MASRRIIRGLSSIGGIIGGIIGGMSFIGGITGIRS